MLCICKQGIRGKEQKGIFV